MLLIISPLSGLFIYMYVAIIFMGPYFLNRNIELQKTLHENVEV